MCLLNAFSADNLIRNSKAVHLSILGVFYSVFNVLLLVAIVN